MSMLLADGAYVFGQIIGAIFIVALALAFLVVFACGIKYIIDKVNNNKKDDKNNKNDKGDEQ